MRIKQRALVLKREWMVNDPNAKSGMIIVYRFQRVLQDFDFASRNRLDVVRSPKTKSLKSLRDMIITHACDLAVEIILVEPAVHKTDGTRSTALHTAAVDSAAGTVVEAVKENPPASKTPDGDNAERISEAGGDSSTGINRKVNDAANEKELAAPTAGENIAADAADNARPLRATENRLEVARRVGGSGGKWPNKSDNRSVEQLSKLLALTLAHEVVRLEADVRRLKELAKTQERQLALQREKLVEMMASAEETQAGFERELRTMNHLVTRVDDSDKRGHEDVANAVQEMRVERANATSQRETVALTLARVEAALVGLKAMIISAISSAAEWTRVEVWQKLVGFENSVANAAERGAARRL
ncbi:unnamed protein product [Closterium sp. Naga37s-1]|nr:unnamed protein product [Closterium sp. Naga37s-1]